ncbi:hypothetical protein SRHO_G00161040 [Serrasalmus rhombeus]
MANANDLEGHSGTSDGTSSYTGQHLLPGHLLLPVKMCTPAKLRIIFDEHKVHKLVLPSGIPSTLQDLTDITKEKFIIPGDFGLMYQDKEFDGEFFTLSSVEDVQDMGPLKVIQTEPVILNLCAMEESDVYSSVQVEYDSRSSTSVTSQDTVLLSSSDEGPSSCRSKPTKRMEPS